MVQALNVKPLSIPGPLVRNGAFQTYGDAAKWCRDNPFPTNRPGFVIGELLITLWHGQFVVYKYDLIRSCYLATYMFEADDAGVRKVRSLIEEQNEKEKNRAVATRNAEAFLNVMKNDFNGHFVLVKENTYDSD